MPYSIKSNPIDEDYFALCSSSVDTNVEMLIYKRLSKSNTNALDYFTYLKNEDRGVESRIKSKSVFTWCGKNVLATGTSIGVQLGTFNMEGETSIVNLYTGLGQRRVLNDIAWNGENLILLGTDQIRGSTTGSALVLDMNRSASSTSTIKPSPILNENVKSVAWLEGERQLFAVGTLKVLKIFDCRLQGNVASMLSKDIHTSSIDGISFNPLNHQHVLTRSFGEISIWDIRRISSDAEFKFNHILKYKQDRNDILDAKWNPIRRGQFAVQCGSFNQEIQFFSTDSSTDEEISSPSLLIMNKPTSTTSLSSTITTSVPSFRRYTEFPIHSFDWSLTKNTKSEVIFSVSTNNDRGSRGELNIEALSVYPFLPSSFTADCQISYVNKSNTVVQPNLDLDMSLVMKKRALEGYSLDPALNKRIFLRQLRNESDFPFKHEQNSDGILFWLQRQLRLWDWVDRCSRIIGELNPRNIEKGVSTHSTGLLNGSVCEIMAHATTEGEPIVNPKIGCKTYQSDSRSLSLKVCGWVEISNSSGLESFISSILSNNNVERAAAIAVFHCDLAVARAILLKYDEKKIGMDHATAELYRIVASTISGFTSTANKSNYYIDTSLWDESCNDLITRLQSMYHPYLVALLQFLLCQHGKISLLKVCNNNQLSWCDRVAFALRFFNEKMFFPYLSEQSQLAASSGEIDALPVVGMTVNGLDLLLKYVCGTADVQTVSFLSCYFPMSEIQESSNWKNIYDCIETYRELLNAWKLWHVRATFDVQRKTTIAEGDIYSFRDCLMPTPPLQQPVPPTITIDCTYCNKSISLNEAMRQNRKFLNSHSKSKSLMVSCYHCKKPLPRCTVCLLNMGVVNPYSEEVFQQNKKNLVLASNDDGGAEEIKLRGSSRTTDTQPAHVAIQFNNWWCWCQKCKHGGHSNHIQEWFNYHDVCAVSECNCNCLTLDKKDNGIMMIPRPLLSSSSPSFKPSSAPITPALLPLNNTPLFI